MKALDMTQLVIARGSRGLFLLASLCAASACGSRGDEPATSDDAGAAALQPAMVAQRLARAKNLVRPGSVTQSHAELGVPTFVWPRPGKPVTPVLDPAKPGNVDPAASAARGALSDLAPLYGLDEADVAEAVVARVDRQPAGPILVSLQSQIDGVEVFGEQLTVVMNQKLERVALSGYLTSKRTAAPGDRTFNLPPAAGAAAAMGQLSGKRLDPALLVSAGAHDGYQHYALSPSAGIALDNPIRLKQVYYHQPSGFEPAYYVEVMAQVGPPPAGVVSATGKRLATSKASSYVISAITGAPLFQKDLMAHAGGVFSYRVWADLDTGIPFDSPAGNGAVPKVPATPDGAQAVFAPTSDVSLMSFPFSHNDPWLAPGATETSGNNADVFVDLFAPDGFGAPTTTTPDDPPTGDFRAQASGPEQFLHTHTPDGNGATAEGRQGSIQQLFYVLNFLHDWYYDAGFNEAAGNTQLNNFGRGGVGGDPVRGQVQVFSSFASAATVVGADGLTPVIRLSNFPSPANHIEIQQEIALADEPESKFAIGVSTSGPQTFDVTGDVVIATFSNSPDPCTVTNAGALTGKIAMFDFDDTDATGCAPDTRITQLNATSAIGVVMVFQQATPNATVNVAGRAPNDPLPFATISSKTGDLIKVRLAEPSTVVVELVRAPDRDEALDTQVVAHEWFHIVSSRLVGNGSGLGNPMGASLGEGWSDFSSLLLSVRAEDAVAPGNESFGGAYPVQTYVSSGLPFDGSLNQGYYFGARRYPYSTDLAINPLTFQHIANGIGLPAGPPIAFGADGADNADAHNAGEVWATMLWECYAALLRDTLGATPRLTFPQAQALMKAYLIAALKATPSTPTLLEARDALLSVALASSVDDYIAFRIAFAKRGAGSHAVAPNRFSVDNAGVVEDFTVGADLGFVSATLDDSLGSCDNDGFLDRGEYGKLTVTLRNTGTVALSQTTAEISASSQDVWFPDGTTITFPAIGVGDTGTAFLRVGYFSTVTGTPTVDFTIDYTDAQRTDGPLTQVASFVTNIDGFGPMDTVEGPTLWTTANGPANDTQPFFIAQTSPTNHVWHSNDPGTNTDKQLVSPVFTVNASGVFGVAFDHDWSFEFGWDGAVVELSINGGGFIDIGGPMYNATLISGNGNPLGGRQGLTGSGSAHTSLTRAVAPGSTVRLRFRFGSDFSVGFSGWNIDNIAFSGVVEAPFPSQPETGECHVSPTAADLSITVTDGVTSTSPGGSVTYTITASNAGPDNITGTTAASVSDSFPSELTCTWVCVGAGDGDCLLSSGAGDISQKVDLPSGGSVTFTASCTISSTIGYSLANTATVDVPKPLSDPAPANNSATDTDTVIHAPSHVTGSKTVSGNFNQGGTVVYTIVLSNDGEGDQPDNATDELVDALPGGLTLLNAVATAGAASVDLDDDIVTWNGTIPAGGSVTIFIAAQISAAPGTTISNQATIHYDSAGDGTNGATAVTDAFVCPAPEPDLARRGRVASVPH